MSPATISTSILASWLGSRGRFRIRSMPAICDVPA
jgi:hypothetical protein